MGRQSIPKIQIIPNTEALKYYNKLQLAYFLNKASLMVHGAYKYFIMLVAVLNFPRFYYL